MLRLAFDFIITWRETRTRPNAYCVNMDLFNELFGQIIFIRNWNFHVPISNESS